MLPARLLAMLLCSCLAVSLRLAAEDPFEHEVPGVEAPEEVAMVRQLVAAGEQAAMPQADDLLAARSCLSADGTGRRLARFAWLVLRRQADPKADLPALLAAMGWLSYNVVGVGEVGVVGGPPPATIRHLILPADLHPAGDRAWQGLIGDLFSAHAADGSADQRRNIATALLQCAAPRELALPIALAWAQRADADAATRALGVAQLGRWGTGEAGVTAFLGLLPRIAGEATEVRLAYAEHLLGPLYITDPYRSAQYLDPPPMGMDPIYTSLLGLLADPDLAVAQAAGRSLHYADPALHSLRPRLLELAETWQVETDRGLIVAQALSSLADPALADLLLAALIDQGTRLECSGYIQNVRFWFSRLGEAHQAAIAPLICARIQPLLEAALLPTGSLDYHQRSQIQGMIDLLAACRERARPQLDLLLRAVERQGELQVAMAMALLVAPEDPRCQAWVVRALRGDAQDAASACRTLAGLRRATPEQIGIMRNLAQHAKEPWLRKAAAEALAALPASLVPPADL